MKNNEMLLRRRNMLLVNVTENILDTETELGMTEKERYCHCHYCQECN